MWTVSKRVSRAIGQFDQCGSSIGRRRLEGATDGPGPHCRVVLRAFCAGCPSAGRPKKAAFPGATKDRTEKKRVRTGHRRRHPRGARISAILSRRGRGPALLLSQHARPWGVLGREVEGTNL